MEHKIDTEYLKDLKERLTTEMASVKTEISLLEGEAKDSREALRYCLEKALNAVQTTFNCLTLIDIQKSIENIEDEIAIDF